MKNSRFYETIVTVRVKVLHQSPDIECAKDIVLNQFKSGTDLYPAFDSVQFVDAIGQYIDTTPPGDYTT